MTEYPNHNNFRGQLYSMQVLEGRPQRASISVSPEIKERVLSLKRGHQTYDDVLSMILETVAVDEKGEENGVVFLNTVYVGSELKKLKKSIPLKISIREDGSLILVNNEFSFLITCKSLSEGMEQARLMFADDYDLYTNPDNQVHPSAISYGKLLKDIVWA